MSDERKTYDVKGTVTISTEEYRDLIEAVKDAEKAFDEYRTKYWHEQDANRRAQEAVDKLSKEKALWNEFLVDHAQVSEDYNAFVYRKRMGEMGDD